MAASHTQPFREHVAELRQRVMAAVAFLFLGAGIGYIFRVPLIDWVRRPLHQNLYYNSPGGGFQFTLQICMVVGLVLALPVAVYGLIRFIQPAFKNGAHKNAKSRKQTLGLISISYILAVTGVAFAYFVILPAALRFFAGFNTGGVQSLISADKYFSFVANCSGAFAVIFQIPLILLFINRITPIPPAKLKKARKWVIVGSFLIALILPFAYDPVTQFLIAVPIIALYELSIILVALTARNKTKYDTTPHSDMVGSAYTFEFPEEFFARKDRPLGQTLDPASQKSGADWQFTAGG